MALRHSELPRRGWMVLSSPGTMGVDVLNHDHDSAQETNHHPLYPQAGVHKGGSNVISLPHRQVGPPVPFPRYLLISSSRLPGASVAEIRRRGTLSTFVSIAIPKIISPAILHSQPFASLPRHPQRAGDNLSVTCCEETIGHGKIQCV